MLAVSLKDVKYIDFLKIPSGKKANNILLTGGNDKIANIFTLGEKNLLGASFRNQNIIEIIKLIPNGL